MLVISLAILVGCRTDDPTTDRPGPDDPPTLSAALTGDGFTVQQGTWAWYDYLDCCDIEGLCIWNNPSSWYGQPALPPAPGQTTADLDDGRWFHLRSDEAMIVLMTAPPRSQYFNYRSYVSIRRITGVDQPLFASLGTSMNHLAMAEAIGGDVWGESLAIVTTTDAAIEARVRDALVAAGHDPRTILLDRIPAEVVYSGLDDDDDLFMAGARLALFDDADVVDAYLAAPVTVLRVSPEAESFTLAHPLPDLPPMGSGTGEQAWASALDELQAAIGARYQDHPRLRSVAGGGTVETFECMANLTCGGDINDRYYGGLPTSFVLPDAEHFVVVFGVNHQRTGKAEYSNMSVDTALHLLAVDGMDSAQMVGTAADYLPDHPLVDDLFAVTVARDCSRHDVACVEVPSTCPGVPEDQILTISFRAYLEAVTGAAPIAAEMLPERAYYIWPVP